MEKERRVTHEHVRAHTHTHRVLPTIDDLLLAAPHHVNVFDADELQLDVGVVVLVLVAFPCCSVRHGVQLHTHTRCVSVSLPVAVPHRVCVCRCVTLGLVSTT